MNVGRINYKQRQLLVDYLSQNKNLVTGKFSNSFTFKDAEKKWYEISNILNSVPGGGKKDWKSWRKTWQDIRSRTKGKAAKNKKHMNGTGGGPFTHEEISTEDQEVLELIDPVVVAGHGEVEESMTKVIFDENNLNEEELRDTVTYSVTEEAGSSSQFKSPRTVITPDVLCSVESTPATQRSTVCNAGRTLQRRGGIKMRKTVRAVEAYEEQLNKKLKLKESYYDRKIAIKQQKNAIAQDTADSLRSIAESFCLFVENM